MKKMTPEQFCYWLQGFAELQASGDFDLMAPDEDQWEMIVEHLQTVFDKVTNGVLGRSTSDFMKPLPYIPPTAVPYSQPSSTCSTGGPGGGPGGRPSAGPNFIC